MTRSVTFDGLTRRMFHAGSVISTLAAQLADCQLQLFFALPFSVAATFFSLTSDAISVCFPYDCKGNKMLVKVHTKPVGEIKTIFFIIFFIFIHSLFPLDGDFSSMKRRGTKEGICPGYVNQRSAGSWQKNKQKKQENKKKVKKIWFDIHHNNKSHLALF